MGVKVLALERNIRCYYVDATTFAVHKDREYIVYTRCLIVQKHVLTSRLWIQIFRIYFCRGAVSNIHLPI